MARMMGPKGMRELSVQTSRGEKVLKAGKDGMFNVNNPKLVKKLKAEGMGVASAGSGMTIRENGSCCNSYVVKETCKECLDRVTTCGKCKTVVDPCRCEEQTDG